MDELLATLKDAAPVLDELEAEIYSPIIEKHPNEANDLLIVRDIAYLKGCVDILTDNVDSIQSNIFAVMLRLNRKD